MNRPPTRCRLTAALLATTGLALGACAGSSPSSSPAPTAAGKAGGGTSTSVPTSTTTADQAAAWAQIDRDVAAVAPQAGFLAARVTPDGACEPVHQLEADAVRPIGSQFKLFVLGTLAGQIAAGDLSWDSPVIVEADDRSFGNTEGSLQFVEPGTEVSVEEAATKMISISDNTATDVLIDLVGRDAVEATARAWMDDATPNEPFLTTREMFRLHYVEGLAERFLATAPDERAGFLASEVDPIPLEQMYPGLTPEPTHIETIEWFATTHDVCRAFAGLQQLQADPALTPLASVLSIRPEDLEVDPGTWPSVWYKGGSEPGVLALGWLATTADGASFVVQVVVTDPDAPLSDTAIADLTDVTRDALALLDGDEGSG